MSDTETRARPNSLYESDFYTWTQEQARLLRERRFDELDLENLVDEVESVGSSEKREIRSRLVVLIGHLLKWKFQPGGRGSSWSDTIFVDYRANSTSDARILEGDVIQLWGEFVGIKSYKAVLGQTIQIPHVVARAIENAG